MRKNTKKILILTGEPSADQHAATLVKELKKREPELEISGMGGGAMKAAGVEIIIDSKKIAMIGLDEIITRLKDIRAVFAQIRSILRNDPPDLLILMDSSGFNLRIAKSAKEFNIHTLYYIAPQIWASRAGRIKKIRERINMMAVTLPFEKKIYQDAKVPVTFVGHPLAHSVVSNKSREQFFEEYNFSFKKHIIGLLPGSRRGELKQLLPTMLKAAELLQEKNNDLQFVLPMAPNFSEKDFAPYLANSSLKSSLILIANDTYNVVANCNAVICASGTATLETALLATPMVIVYRVSWFTAFIMRIVIKLSYIGLCNIIAEKKVVQELLQEKMSAKNIAAEISRILEDKEYREKMIGELQEVKISLQSHHADKDIASLVLEQLKENTTTENENDHSHG